MTDEAINTAIADKVMGWEKGIYANTDNEEFEAWYKDNKFVIFVKRCYGGYNPRNNVAQAIEALEAWLKAAPHRDYESGWYGGDGHAYTLTEEARVNAVKFWDTCGQGSGELAHAITDAIMQAIGEK